MRWDDPPFVLFGICRSKPPFRSTKPAGKEGSPAAFFGEAVPAAMGENQRSKREGRLCVNERYVFWRPLPWW